MKYYPIFMNLEGRGCLVVGAGAVAARKARSLMECGATVTVVGEDPVPSLRRLEARGLTVRSRKFRSGDLKGHTLVFGATDDAAVNRRLSRESRRRGLPVNIADDSGASTFIVPAVYRRRDLSIAVSTSGKSPAAARAIRKDLPRHYGSEYAALISLLGAHRKMMMEAVPGHRQRAALWRKILGEDLLGILRREGRGAAAAVVRRRIREAGKGGERE